MSLKVLPIFLLAVAITPARADQTPQPIPFAQNWSNTALISSNDTWTGVPGIIGARGDGITAGTAVDPQTLLADDTPVLNVLANQTADPATIASGGLAEFESGDATVAMKGSGTADAPYLLLSVNLTGQSNVGVRYRLRDLDGSANNAVQPVALHARIGSSGSFSNIPEAFVADATSANSATQVTPVSIVLPAIYSNQPVVQLRIMTSNAVGVDEWVGVDDIEVGGSSVDNPPSVSATVPANGASDVALDSNISITFSEDVSVSGNWYSLSCAGNAQTASASGGPRVYVLDPTAALPSGQSCTLTIFASGVRDTDGTLDPMSADVVVNFQVANDIAPSISSTIPLNNQSNVALAANLQVNFSEAVDTAAGAFTLSCTLSGAHALSISSNAAGNQRTLDPSPDFSPSESCTLQITGALITDRDGAPDALVGNPSISFSTANGSGYYASVDASSPSTLRNSLHQVIRGHTCLFYSSSICTSPGEGDSVWRILETADEAPGDSTRTLDVYKNETYRKCLDRAGINNNANTSFNREHVWPNSYGFNDRATVQVNGTTVANCPYTDAHMLFVSNVQYNSDRGNRPFDFCPNGCTERTTLANNGDGGGSGIYPGNSNWFSANVFEPWNVRKGDLARAILYADIRYEGGTHPVLTIAEPDLRATNDAALITTTPSGAFAAVAYMGMLDTLLFWNRLDRPDAREQRRNEVVFSFQGNRNPFIDNPDYAECLFRGFCGDVIFRSTLED
jgi:endonuclease I